jgi:hypothetical protein
MITAATEACSSMISTHAAACRAKYEKRVAA